MLSSSSIFQYVQNVLLPCSLMTYRYLELLSINAHMTNMPSGYHDDHPNFLLKCTCGLCVRPTLHSSMHVLTEYASVSYF